MSWTSRIGGHADTCRGPIDSHERAGARSVCSAKSMRSQPVATKYRTSYIPTPIRSRSLLQRRTEFAEEICEISPCEAPLERLGDGLVMPLEVEYASRQGVKGIEVVRREYLSLEYREVDLDLVQ